MANEVRLIDANSADVEKIACYYGSNCHVEDVQEWLNDQPTIDPESLRPVGKWKLHSNGSGTCSQCKFTQKNVWDDDHWQHYCGVCGAMMKGENDD